VKYWASESVAFQYGEFIMPSQWGDDPSPSWLASFGERRIERASDLLGDEVVKRAVGEAHADFRRSRGMTLRQWDMLMNGTLEEYRQLGREHQPPSVNVAALQEEEKLQEDELNRWIEQNQAARHAYRESSQRLQTLRDEAERLQEEIDSLERSIGMP
jgi:hypothetical protein